MKLNAKTWVKRLSQERPNTLGHFGYSDLIRRTYKKVKILDMILVFYELLSP